MNGKQYQIQNGSLVDITPKIAALNGGKAYTGVAPIIIDNTNDTISVDLQLKADVNLGNVTAPGNVRMAHAAMPSGQYIDLTLPTSGGTVTAPADGWINWGGGYTSGGYLSFSVEGLKTTAIVNGNYVWIKSPVSSGQTITFFYPAGGYDFVLDFYYANGSAS